MSYRIKSVATLTGISPATLRAWERRYHLISPDRTQSGYRVYDDSDVRMLVQVKSLVDRGFKAGEAIALMRRGAALAPVALDASALDLARQSLLDAALRLDRGGCSQALSRIQTLAAARQIDEVLLPLLREVGGMWERGEATVAQEHFCSILVRDRFSAMLDVLASEDPESPEAICAGAQGDRHELGLLAVAVHLAARGWRVTYLGTDLPIGDLVEPLRSRKPALLCSSVVLPRSPADCLSVARALRDASPDETCVVLGGAGLSDTLPRRPQPGLHLLREIHELLRLAPRLEG